MSQTPDTPDSHEGRNGRNGRVPRPRLRTVLRLLLATAALGMLATAAAAGWIWHRDQQVIARYAPAPADATHAAGNALDQLMGDCRQPPPALQAEIAAHADLVHEDSSGDWGGGQQMVKVYRHRYLDYYVEYSTGFFPVQRRLCRID